jgi:Protein phosphatase 2C
MASAAWKVIGASVTGRSHEATGKDCEDASDWLTEPGLTCLAVADGAGSRPLSRVGASLAVRRALETAGVFAASQAATDTRAQTASTADGGGTGRAVDAADPAAWLRVIFADVRDQITVLAAADCRDAEDYATTLAVAVVTSEVIGIGQIGDTIAVTGGGSSYQTAAPAPRGEYVNETTFITAAGALDELRITVLPAAEVDSVFLSTDGLRFKILDDLAAASPFTPFFEDLTAYARSPDATLDAVRRFLAGLDDQSGDDKTLLAAVKTRLAPDRIQEHARGSNN